MAETLSYADALKILGFHDSRLMKMVDAMATGGLAAWSGAAWLSGAEPGVALGLFDLKNDAIRYGYETVRKISEWRSGLSRFSRTERLAAAHAVVVVSSYFQALEQADLPFELKRLDLTRGDQVAQATGNVAAENYAGMVQVLLRGQLPMPSPHRPYRETKAEIQFFYLRLSEQFALFVRGLSIWDELDQDKQIRLHSILKEQVTMRAVELYEDNYRLLAVDNREFEVWSLITETRSVGAGLSHLAELVREIAPPRSGDRPLQRLMMIYQSALDEPIIPVDQVPEGVVLPLLGRAYVNPRGRVAEVQRDNSPTSNSWWNEQPILPDTEAFLLGHLSSPRASREPLVVLGEPGSGKSKLTEVLAARLVNSDFLPLRVELRHVKAESSIVEQIEQAISRELDQRVEYQELVDAAQGALPVVMLDGFDELLQAANLNRFNYLEDVRNFQLKQQRKNQPIAVIVTSRTVVADRVTFPDATLTVQLQPFDEEQIRCWVGVWEKTNRAVLAGRDLLPLTAEAALAQGELAEQPLLLLLLAIYDATGNALQRSGAELGHAQLYQALLMDFALREVRKTSRIRELSNTQQRKAAEKELSELGVVALAMFVRGRQVVTETQLNADLPVLLPDRRSELTEDERKLSRAHRVAGRFFFVHKNQARAMDDKVRSYEFLHATFGEFLVPWLVVHELCNLIQMQKIKDEWSRSAGEEPDDSFLYSALSFSCLADRAPILEFLEELLVALPNEDRQDAQALLVDLLRGALHERSRRFADYRPVRYSIARRLAAYTANLTLMITRVAENEVDIEDLFVADESEQSLYSTKTGPWRAHTHLWKGQLESEWEGLIDQLHVRRERLNTGVFKFFASSPQRKAPKDDNTAFSPDAYFRDDPVIDRMNGMDIEDPAPGLKTLYEKINFSGYSEEPRRIEVRAAYAHFNKELPYLLNRDLDILSNVLDQGDLLFGDDPGLVIGVSRNGESYESFHHLVLRAVLDEDLGVNERHKLFVDILDAFDIFFPATPYLYELLMSRLRSNSQDFSLMIRIHLTEYAIERSPRGDDHLLEENVTSIAKTIGALWQEVQSDFKHLLDIAEKFITSNKVGDASRVTRWYQLAKVGIPTPLLMTIFDVRPLLSPEIVADLLPGVHNAILATLNEHAYTEPFSTCRRSPQG